MDTITSRTCNAGDCSIHCLECGASTRSAVILLHGMKFQAATWQELGTLEHLAQAGWRGLAIDMPGFGQSPACDCAPGAVVDGCMEAARLERPVLIGPSMGGRIALEYAMHRPEALAGLVLIGPVGVRENEHALHAVTVPTLLLWGENDTIAPLAHSEILLGAIRDSHLIVLKGASHPCYLEQPGAWHTALADFLASLPGKK